MEQNHPLLSYFYEISAIPRPSYKEQKIAAHLMEFARSHSLEAVCDASSNVLIRKPASAGYENAPGVVLQGHTDMVCEKNAGTVHDFDTDPIEIIREGDILRANGTTLGADNGYAVAAMMAILADDSLPHPALECLFTTAEEVGLDGMREFDKTQLKSKFMLNLDSGGEEYATAACAGGVRTNFSRTCE
ncbi:MAG: M20/M25/M40 family metallo-hydrolase, partial [Clostridia bacterium]|nr:M20/M25/M40 family metallo-hydrolase [Clostridia bacterium]